MLRRPVSGEELAVARISGRHHAVEHVDAARDALDEVERRARAHQIAGPIVGQPARSSRGDVVHHIDRLADAQPADRVSVEPDREGAFGAALAQIRKTPPWTIPNCACPGLVTADIADRAVADGENRSRARRAHRSVRSIDASAASCGAGYDRHSSSIIAMSEPSRAWMSTARSGDRRCALPSRCDWN